MGRAPCCDKAGLKKGPWTSNEDLILSNYIIQNGHGNWRALPKRAGLLRCGKSCRLRWMNYLRPDIKRGNFSKEEEEIIITLHAELGNKWSIIAARLPGRTDNEIKNVWHTHLKKRLAGKSQPESETMIGKSVSCSYSDRKVEEYPEPGSPTHSFSETSSVTATAAAEVGGSDDFNVDMMAESLENLMEIGESFWSEVFSGEDWSGNSDFSSGNGDSQLQSANSVTSDLNMEDSNDFWQNVFHRAEEFTELSEF